MKVFKQSNVFHQTKLDPYLVKAYKMGFENIQKEINLFLYFYF